jgi:hypothetical protein
MSSPCLPPNYLKANFGDAWISAGVNQDKNQADQKYHHRGSQQDIQQEQTPLLPVYLVHHVAGDAGVGSYPVVPVVAGGFFVFDMFGRGWGAFRGFRLRGDCFGRQAGLSLLLLWKYLNGGIFITLSP